MNLNPQNILWTFVLIKTLHFLFERFLSRKNREYCLDQNNQKLAIEKLGISQTDMDKTLAYSQDKFLFGQIVGLIKFVGFMAFLILGGFGWIEQWAYSQVQNPIAVGLLFFGLLGLISMVFNLPFDYLKTFFLEEKHGFNKTNKKTFFLDRIKGVFIGVLLGGSLVGALLWIMGNLSNWWLWAWIVMTGFSLVTMVLYPTFLAPLFNKFTQVPEGELKTEIDHLAQKVGFNHSGVSIMNASMRSSHGNAYFTGVFGKKKIVLFDTLVEALKPKQVVAVLAHELGHFKLNHVRWSLIRSTITTGLIFYLLSLCLPLENFYTAFKLEGVSNYGALLVFSMWFGLIDIVMQPIESFISRKNEFAADRFAREHYPNGSQFLKEGLLKLRETSSAMPISHPLFSAYYYSHPPMIERLKALEV